MKLSKMTSVLGLALSGNNMAAAVLRREGAHFRVHRAIHVPLSLDPLTSDPELMGREIRNHLDGAGISERKCVFCVPLKWVLTAQTELPDSAEELNDEDIDSFIAVQAEREFPFSPDDLSVSVSRYDVPDEAGRAMIAALPMNHLATLEKVLKAANLRPLSITLGVTSVVDFADGAFGDDGSESNSATVLVGDDGADMEIKAGNGVAALRALAEAVDVGPEGRMLDVDDVAMQLRITLGRLPRTLRGKIDRIKVYAPDDMCRQVADELRGAMGSMGIDVVAKGTDWADGRIKFSDNVAGNSGLIEASQTAVAAAAGRLLGKSARFEFLPPKVTRFKQLVGHMSTKGTMWLVGTAVAVVVLTCSAFIWQYAQLARLESRWDASGPEIKDAEKLRDDVRQYRAWFDDSAQSMVILRELTNAFPVEGRVWLKKLEVENLETVECSVSAKTDDDMLAVLEKLRETRGIKDLQWSELRGNSPLEFRLSYRWVGGASHGS